VTAAEIKAVAQQFFRPERLKLALVSPLKRDTGVEKILKI
jgi:hypothetical protein